VLHGLVVELGLLRGYKQIVSKDDEVVKGANVG
jgi:hypothetical protein